MAPPNMRIGHIGLVLLLLLAAAYVLFQLGAGTTATAVSRRALGGVWVASPEYCARAKLQNMTLMVLPREDRQDGEHKGYLVATRDDGELVSNQPLRINVGMGRRAALSPHGAVLGSLGIAHAHSPVWPGRLRFAIDPAAQRLQLYDGAKTWGVLYRDGAASSMLDKPAPLEGAP